jgi:hypothetical protein
MDNHDFSRAIDVHEQMHNLFVLALLASHPDPETVRGQFRRLLNGMAAAHSRYVFGDDFVVSVRRSILRFDRMLRMVLTARHEMEIAVADAEAAMAETPVQADVAKPVQADDASPVPAGVVVADGADVEVDGLTPPEHVAAAGEPEERAT